VAISLSVNKSWSTRLQLGLADRAIIDAHAFGGYGITRYCQGALSESCDWYNGRFSQDWCRTDFDISSYVHLRCWYSGQQPILSNVPGRSSQGQKWLCGARSNTWSKDSRRFASSYLWQLSFVLAPHYLTDLCASPCPEIWYSTDTAGTRGSSLGLESHWWYHYRAFTCQGQVTLFLFIFGLP
jgi:hypothetical protein